MWLYTTRGFYSVVQDKQASDQLVVRSRVREDLDNLRADLMPELGLTISTPERDYQFRAYISRTDFASGLARLATDLLTYSNFKEAVGERQGHRRATLYSRIWADTMALAHYHLDDAR